MSDRPRLRPDLAIVISTLLWGTMWIPAREMNALGWGGGLAMPGSFLIAGLILAPVAVTGGRWRRCLRPAVLVPGACMAIGIALYIEGLLRSDVARVVLLFYLLPVWSTILDRIVSGRSGSVRRAAGIVLGLIGMGVVFHDGTGLPLPRNLGDYMGLASGVVWALGFAFAGEAERHQAEKHADDGLFPIVFVNAVLLAPAAWLLTLLPGDRHADTAGFGTDLMSGPVWLLVYAILWLLPAIALTLHGARHLAAAQVAIFLMMEVVISLATAAVLLDESFGFREMIGAILIIGASLLEVAPRSSGKVDGGAVEPGQADHGNKNKAEKDF